MLMWSRPTGDGEKECDWLEWRHQPAHNAIWITHEKVGGLCSRLEVESSHYFKETEETELDGAHRYSVLIFS